MDSLRAIGIDRGSGLMLANDRRNSTTSLVLHCFAAQVPAGVSMPALNRRSLREKPIKLRAEKSFFRVLKTGLDPRQSLPYSPHPRTNNTLSKETKATRIISAKARKPSKISRKLTDFSSAFAAQ